MGSRKANSPQHTEAPSAKPRGKRTSKAAASAANDGAAPASTPPLGMVEGLAPSTDPTRPDFAWWSIERVKPWVQNPRKNARAVGKVADSIRRWGWGRPLVVNDWPGCAGELIIGHTAWLAAHELKLEQVPVRIRRMEPAAAHALAIADNKLGEISDWDADELGRIVGSGEISDADLGLAGFTEDELSKLLEPVHAPGDFSEVTINAETQYTCPRCHYEWRGKPTSSKKGDDAASKTAAE